jgi:hypothetical protein
VARRPGGQLVHARLPTRRAIPSSRDDRLLAKVFEIVLRETSKRREE